ncbi:MAG: hypothetical protein M1818_005831 [Claussenomyces sp. TS43310]|nr:MAG: hypothetical protein M1818_005831 [Claussenomyces sp. TS43310]
MSLRRDRRTVALRSHGMIADLSSRMSRPRRSINGPDPAVATVSRDPPSSPSNPQSLRLTVKLGTSKLREATGGAVSPGDRAAASSHRRDAFLGGEILEGKRSRNIKKSYVLESDSDEDDEDMEDVMDDEEVEGDSLEEDDIDEDDGDEDAEGDVEMDLEPPPPTIKVSRGAKPVIKVKPTGRSDGKTVEQKEAGNGSDDDLSELDSDMEPEETMQLQGDEDGEGEEEEIVVEDGEGDEEEVVVEDDEDDLDSDDDRGSTPDLAKLTKRQRAREEEVQVKKHLTAEEHAMRRAEMARRRKNLSEKRNEEEKMETINKLLKKQAPKTNARRRDLNGNDETPNDETAAPNAIFTRWVSNKDGNVVAVPTEWLGGPIGSLFIGGKLVEEVE